MMLQAHKETDIFKYAAESDEEKNLPRIFEKQQKTATVAKQDVGTPCIVDQKEFARNFSVFTEDQLRFVNW